MLSLKKKSQKTFRFELSIWQNVFKFSNNGIKYFTSECSLELLYLKFTWNCSLDQQESYKKEIRIIRSPLVRWPLFLHFSLFILFSV